jgi:hypothetical protein
MKPEQGITGYHAWQKAVMSDGTLREIAGDGYFDIRVIAFAIALAGENGRGCFAASETIAGQVGTKRGTIDRYRKQLIDLGWFAIVSRNGGANRRSVVLDIALPEVSNGQAPEAT